MRAKAKERERDRERERERDGSCLGSELCLERICEIVESELGHQFQFAHGRPTKNTHYLIIFSN